MKQSKRLDYTQASMTQGNERTLSLSRKEISMTSTDNLVGAYPALLQPIAAGSGRGVWIRSRQRVPAQQTPEPRQRRRPPRDPSLQPPRVGGRRKSAAAGSLSVGRTRAQRVHIRLRKKQPAAITHTGQGQEVRATGCHRLNCTVPYKALDLSPSRITTSDFNDDETGELVWIHNSQTHTCSTGAQRLASR